MRLTPLPFTCLHESYTAGEVDGHGNTLPGFEEPVEVACMWWPVSTEEPPGPPTGSERVVAERNLVIDVAVRVDHRDRFIFDGQRFEVAGIPQVWDFGPFGFTPNRQVIELRMVR